MITSTTSYPKARALARTLASLAVAAVATTTSVQAAPALIADVRADYRVGQAYLGTTADFNAGLGLSDTAVAGHWNYYCKDATTGNLTLLKFGKNPSWPNAYGGEGNTANGGWSDVSDQALWGGAPQAGELTWHPGGEGSSPQGPTIIRWTADASQAGTVNITGYTRLGAATSVIFVGGTQLWTSPTKPNNRAVQQTFNLTDVIVAAGTTVDFVLYGGPDGASFINAQIYQVSTATPPPAAPTGLTATPFNRGVDLSWTASVGATGYDVKRSAVDGGPYETIATGIAATTWQDTGLSNGTPYYYVVSAGNSSGTSDNSAQAGATPRPPLAPTGVGATAGNKQVDLGWTASAGATGYNVKRSSVSGGPYTTIATDVTGTTYADSGLTNGTTYYYVVSALATGDEGPDSLEASATPRPVAAPAGLTARGINTQVKLGWTAPVGAVDYNIKRSPTDGGPYTTIATGVTATTYQDTGLTNGTTYYYVVSSTNSDGEGPDSIQASAVPEPVLADLRADYVAGVSNGQTTQTVTANPAGIADVAGTGVWNFHRLDYSASDDPAAPNYDGVLTLLPWNTNAYNYAISIISTNPIYDGMTPAAGEVAWHPGGVPEDPYNGTPRNTVIRWTAGASAPATVELTGGFRLPWSGYSQKSFCIYVNGVLQYSYFSSAAVDVDNNVSHTYDLKDLAMAPGTTIDFVLKGGSAGRAALAAKIANAAVPPAGDYTSWAANQDPPITGGPDHVGPDGISNLMLYALDLKLDGTNGSPGTLSDKTVTFQKRADAVANGDVSYAIETSPDLQTWSPAPPHEDTASVISYVLPDGQGKVFARLVVSPK